MGAGRERRHRVAGGHQEPHVQRDLRARDHPSRPPTRRHRDRGRPRGSPRGPPEARGRRPGRPPVLRARQDQRPRCRTRGHRPNLLRLPRHDQGGHRARRPRRPPQHHRSPRNRPARTPTAPGLAPRLAHGQALPLVDHIADKICAIHEWRETTPSNRFRDLADVLLISQRESLDAAACHHALHTEAALRRARHPRDRVRHRDRAPGPTRGQDRRLRHPAGRLEARHGHIRGTRPVRHRTPRRPLRVHLAAPRDRGPRRPEPHPHHRPHRHRRPPTPHLTRTTPVAAPGRPTPTPAPGAATHGRDDTAHTHTRHGARPTPTHHDPDNRRLARGRPGRTLVDTTPAQPHHIRTPRHRHPHAAAAPRGRLPCGDDRCRRRRVYVREPDEPCGQGWISHQNRLKGANDPGQGVVDPRVATPCPGSAPPAGESYPRWSQPWSRRRTRGSAGRATSRPAAPRQPPPPRRHPGLWSRLPPRVHHRPGHPPEPVPGRTPAGPVVHQVPPRVPAQVPARVPPQVPPRVPAQVPSGGWSNRGKRLVTRPGQGPKNSRLLPHRGVSPYPPLRPEPP
ncbi:nucleotidyl transferase AbiEii/AbiGii toxin family protein [Embleya sp. NPDC005575]|uniref:nucleotidyl transferase AbiEii/AbiGii toxin family protein n=1 Tax=Embleya sp. NPDC005575 TaxID=3156892 RepID=UPI0033B75C80